MPAGWLKTSERDGALLLQAGGAWDVASVGRLDTALRGLRARDNAPLTVDLGDVDRLDTAGAWLIYRTLRDMRKAGVKAETRSVKPDHLEMLDQVAANDKPCEVEPPRVNALVACVDRVGVGTIEVLDEARQVLGFFGLIMQTLLRTLLRPGRLRGTPLVYHMEQVGVNALPIVGLISFLIGVVLAYQGAVQLQRFGAEVFVVNLIGVSILRELGILLTAIVVAGRSGSAFAAQIGSMMVHEEVDAMRTLGLDPIEVLVLPRVLALVLMLPVLAFWADLMGLLGGGVMAWLVLDISPGLYIDRLRDAVSVASFWVGIGKAPVFGFLIAMIGCLEGMRVSGSAESVGKQTTRAVVTSIFLVIVVDALFSIFFSFIGV